MVHPLATLPFVFLFFLFYDIAYTPMLIAYTLEILPFNIRAKGFAVMVSLINQRQDSKLISVLEFRGLSYTGVQPVRKSMGT